MWGSYSSADNEKIWDEEGREVPCDCCRNGYFVWKDGDAFCPECERTKSRTELFNYIGAELPTDECLMCNGSYPACKAWCETLLAKEG